MDKIGALFIFYICGALGFVFIGVGLGSMYGEGIGFMTVGIGSIILIPSGILFNNHVEKFIRE